jgi:hypothetical protein
MGLAGQVYQTVNGMQHVFESDHKGHVWDSGHTHHCICLLTAYSMYLYASFHCLASTGMHPLLRNLASKADDATPGRQPVLSHSWVSVYYMYRLPGKAGRKCCPDCCSMLLQTKSSTDCGLLANTVWPQLHHGQHITHRSPARCNVLEDQY